jgi:hypothetical protein
MITYSASPFVMLSEDSCVMPVNTIVSLILPASYFTNVIFFLCSTVHTFTVEFLFYYVEVTTNMFWKVYVCHCMMTFLHLMATSKLKLITDYKVLVIYNYLTYQLTNSGSRY